MSGGEVPLLPPPVPPATLHSFNSSMVSLRPKPIVISICLLFVVLMYWTWSSTSSSKASFIKSGVDPLLKNSNLRCINDDFLLTKKIRRCENDGSLKSVKPLEFKPRQISLTFFGVKGEMGVSWVTYDGDQVGIGVLTQAKTCFGENMTQNFYFSP